MEKTIEIPECKDKAYSGMDYEKEYKAMVQRARELYESGNALTKLQMGIVCPELAESEDEKVRKALLRCCDDWEKGQFGCMAKEDVPAIRAYLERQKEREPAEWSEKDEKMIDNIDKSLSSFKLGKHYIEQKQIEAERKWLKSLHPSWKPSEEQMEALNEIINTLAVSKHPHENDYLFNILNGLRKNLKSL